MDHGIPIKISSSSFRFHYFLHSFRSTLQSFFVSEYTKRSSMILLIITPFFALLGAGAKPKQISWKGTVSVRKDNLIFELFRLTKKKMQQKKNRDFLRRESEPLALRKGSVVLWILNWISQRNFELFPLL